jgi:imidazolonepropionase-like amidohydrolase
LLRRYAAASGGESAVRRWLSLAVLIAGAIHAWGQTPPDPTAKLIREKSPLIAITHVLVVDGTGAAPAEDQTIVFDHGKIVALGASVNTAPPAGAKVIDGTGKTLLPGLVGMHEHLFYVGPSDKQYMLIEQPFSFPQLYLASGVTTARTTGSMDPYQDLAVKADVDSGKLPGPNLFLTTPYLEGSPRIFSAMHSVASPEEAKDFVRYWHSVGFTSVKAYADIGPAELGAGIEEAHKLGMKVTGHLCSVSFRQAAALGIDNLEHGPFLAPDSELFPGKLPGTCGEHYFEIFGGIVEKADPNGAEAQAIAHDLIAHHVPITSTLAVAESGTRLPIGPGTLGDRAKQLLTVEEWSGVLTARAMAQKQEELWTTLVKKEMAFELAFAKAGGTLMAGCDPTGDGHTLAGLGDQRQMELLVEAGFTPAEAVKIYTMNGAQFLGIADKVGSIAVGKQADLILMPGNFVKDPTAIERTEIVFKNGVGYDSQAIYESLAGQVGMR